MTSAKQPNRVAWISLFLVGLMATLPFLQPRHFQPIPLFYSEWLAVVLGLAAVTLLLLKRSAPQIEVPVVTFVPLVLAGLLLVHVALGRVPYPEQGILGVGYLLWSAALVVAGRLLSQAFGFGRLATSLAWFMVAGGAVSALAGILQHYELRGILESLIATKVSRSMYGNLVQPNHFATYIALALTSLVLLCARSAKPLLIAWFLYAILLFVLSLSGSRSSWLYLIMVAISAMWFYRRKATGERKRLMVFAVLLVPGFVLAQLVAQLPWLAAPEPSVTATERLVALVSGGSARFQLWREAWAMFLEAPLFGAGYGQFSWNHFLLSASATEATLTGNANHAHNILLQWMAELGLVGVVLPLAALAIWFLGLKRQQATVETWWAICILAIIGIHSLLELPLWYAYFLGVTSILLGATDNRCLALRFATPMRATIGVVLLAGWFGAFSLIRNYYVLEVSLFPRSHQASKAELEKTHRDLMAVHGSLLAPYVELAFARVLDLSKQDIERKIAFSERVMRFAPTPIIVFRHSVLLALRGDRDAALRALERAVGAYPGEWERMVNAAYLQGLAAELDGLGERERRETAFLREKIQAILDCRELRKTDKICQ